MNELDAVRLVNRFLIALLLIAIGTLAYEWLK